jgi:hypothetical protein
MEKVLNIAIGFVLGIVCVAAVGFVKGVPGICVYFNSCEPNDEIVKLQKEITGLNEQIKAKSSEIEAASAKVVALLNEASASLKGTRKITDDLIKGMGDTSKTLDLLEEYVRHQNEVEGYVNQILCMHKPELVTDNTCGG